MELPSRELGVEVYRLGARREQAMSGMAMSLKGRMGDRLQADLDTARKRTGEPTTAVELLATHREKSVPWARRRSRRC